MANPQDILDLWSQVFTEDLNGNTAIRFTQEAGFRSIPVDQLSDLPVEGVDGDSAIVKGDGLYKLYTYNGLVRATADFRTENLGDIYYNDGNVGIGTASPNSTLQVNGSVSKSYVAKTGAYTLTANDYTVDCTANTFTITLPTAVDITGRIYNIKNTGTGVITVDGDGTETIDDELSQTIDQRDNMQIQSTGTNRIIL